MTLDLSGLIGTLDVPSEEGWVLDVFLYRPEHVTYAGEGFWSITSRNDAVLVNGARFQRIVLGTLSDGSTIAPEPNGRIVEGTAVIDGVPAGGPYVMLVLVRQDGFNPPAAWLTANESGQLLPFSIQPNETTQIKGQSIAPYVNGQFENPEEPFGVAPG